MGVWDSKAQIAMEYLVIFSISFLMTIPLIIIFATQTSNLETDVANAQLERLADELDAASSEVFFMGKPARKTFSVTFPEGINGIIIEPKMIRINMSNGPRTFEFVKETQVNVTGSLKTFSGVHVVTVESKGNYVEISDK